MAGALWFLDHTVYAAGWEEEQFKCDVCDRAGIYTY